MTPPEQPDDWLRSVVEQYLDGLELQTSVRSFYFEDMPTREIAQALGSSPSTVRGRLFRARKKLYAEFDKGKQEIE